MAGGNRKGVKQVPAAEFVAAWQGSQSVKEVCEKTGTSYNNVLARRTKLVDKGVQLKEMPRAAGGNRVDVEALNAQIAASAEAK